MPETAQTTTPDWLDAFMKEVRSISPEEFTAPSKELEQGMEVIGEITDASLKQLWTAFERARSEALIAHESTVASEQDEEEADLTLVTAEKKVVALWELFWLGVRSSGVTSPHGIGLRANWQVVALEPKPRAHPVLIFGVLGH